LNAELALFLIEQGIPLAKAKVIAAEATSAADIAFGILDALPGAMTVTEARELAARAPLVVDMRSGRAVPAKPEPLGPQPVVLGEHDTPQVAHGTYSPVVGVDGLTDKQRAALGKVGLCPNCQQPKNDHLPGCARVSANGFEPMDPKARTKDPLPPAV
jgi:hypothetical protein